MAHVAFLPERFVGKSVGSGQCVALVQAAAPGVGPTSAWRPGERVKGAGHIPSGTVIATFIHGRYPNNEHGNHAAIYLGHTSDGIRVIDQWKGQAAHERVIQFKRGDNDPSNDGDFFYVVE